MQTLIFDRKDNIAMIHLNRPNQMNAFNQQMATELVEVTNMIATDENIRAVLLNGAGPLFMAGGDIKFFYEHLDEMPKGVMEIIEKLNITITNLMTMEKPVLASVHGSVAGVGVSLMMACDLVIAAQSTKFTMAYSGLGISPDGGASYLLPHIVGTKKAMEWLLLSDLFSAEDAKANGLLNWVVADEDLTLQTEKLLRKLVNGPTKSYSYIKKLVNQSRVNSLQDHLVQEAYAFESCTTTLDFKAGVTAFLNKTKPLFIGK